MLEWIRTYIANRRKFPLIVERDRRKPAKFTMKSAERFLHDQITDFSQTVIRKKDELTK